MTEQINKRLAREAKAIVALAFRNGPIEDVHAGKPCPTCHGKDEFSRISDSEMRVIMKSAVDHIYRLLTIRRNDPERYETLLAYGSEFTTRWAEPMPISFPD